MSQGLARVKKRIKSVESTRKITSSMKLVSSVKIRKMSKIAATQSNFFAAMSRVLNDSIFADPNNEYNSPYLVKPINAAKRIFVVVTSNMGLCAGYNNNVIHLLKENLKNNDEVVIIGEKGDVNLKGNKDIIINEEFVNLGKNFDLNKVRLLINYLSQKFLSEEYEGIYLVYTMFKNSISFIPKIDQIYPIKINKNPRYKFEPIYVGGKDEFINKLIPQYVSTNVYLKIYCSFLSEESSRRNAMDNADKNAQDLSEKLQLEYNKARQASITQEITEIVNGSRS